MKLQVGAVQINKVVEDIDNSLPLQFGFPDVTAKDLAELAEWYQDDLLTLQPEASRMKLNLHSFVMQVGGKTVLIDACAGNHKKREIPFFDNLATDYLANLEATGHRPEDIDYVLCTHLHFDHIGWNTRLENGSWVPTFPNARYIFSRDDYEYFDANREDPLYGWAFVDSVLPVVEHGLADIVATDHSVIHELTDQLWLEPAPGHSPGSCLIHAKVAENHAVFTGDAFHHPLQLARPDLQLAADLDPALGCRTRSAIFERYAETDTVLCPAHFGRSSAGRVRRHRRNYRFEFLEPEA